MATTTQTWGFNVTRTTTTLTLVSLSGKKSLTLNLKTLESLWDTLTAQEQGVYLGIENDTTVNVQTEMSLTMPEMTALASISKKITPMTVEKAVAQSANVIKNGIASRIGSTVTDKDATNAEHRVSALNNLINACDEEYYMLQYDIPTVKADVCPSPCNLLWRYGFRTTLSVWILPKSSLEAQDIIDLLTLWKANSIKVRVMKYDADEVANIKEMAREELDEEIRRIHTSLIENIGRADDQLREAMSVEGPITPNQADKAEEYRNNRVRSMIKIAAESLDRAIACAQLFDTEEKVADLLTALRETIASQKATFNVRVAQTGRKGV